MSTAPARTTRRTLPLVVVGGVAGAGWLLATLARGDVGKVLEEPANGAMGDWLLGATQPGRWLIGAALLLAALLAAKWTARSPWARIGTPLAIAGAAVLALLSLRGLAGATKHATLGSAGDVWWLDDDMMITLRYARNLVEGRGLVWNAGERVEGITNFLWALLLAIPQILLGPSRAALGAIVLNGALLVAALALAFALVRRLGGSRVAAALACFALATHQGTLHWAAGGSEAILLAVLLLAQAWCACGEGEATPREAALGALAGGLALLTRPDALPVAGVLMVALVLRCGGRAQTLRAVALFVALPLLQIVFRLAYYHELLPNTYYLKMTGWSTRPLAGLDYLVRLLSQHALHVAFALAALLAARRRASAFLLAALLLFLAYVAWAGGDELPKQRFFVPVAPLLFALSLVGAEQLALRIGGARDAVADGDAPCRPLWLPWSVVVVAGLGGGFLPGQTDPGSKRRADAELACVQQGLLIRENTQPDATIAVFWAGATPYFSERRGIDLLGKCDPVIAHEDAKPGLMKPGHNKYDFPRSLALLPDVVVSGAAGVATIRQLESIWGASPYRCFYELYLSPAFLPEYVGAARVEELGPAGRMPQFVGGTGTKLPLDLANTSRGFHAIFVRRDSTRALSPADWVAPR
jgi:hypothetical protein